MNNKHKLMMTNQLRRKLANGSMLTAMATMLTLLSGCGGQGDTTTSAPVVQSPAQAPVIQSPAQAQCAGRDLPDDATCMTLNERDTIIYKPQSEINGIALFLHGAPGSAKKVANLFDAASLSNEFQLIAASPQGSEEFWGWDSLHNTQEPSVDAEFVSELINQIRVENTILSDNVFVFGYSAGGFMAYKLACDIPENITAVVALAGQFRGDFEACTTNTPVTVHHLHSATDRDVPIHGRSSAQIQSVEDTLAHWRIINGCSEQVVETQHSAVIEGSGGTHTTTWQGCVKPVSFSELDDVPHESQYDAAALQQIYAPIFE